MDYEMQNGTIRSYYKIVGASGAVVSATRKNTCNAQGIQAEDTSFAHEPPQIQLSPDGKTAVIRIHWQSKDASKDTFEANSYVSPLSDIEAAVLVASWSKEGS